MAGSPINPAMQQYLNGLNATVYSATAGLPTAGVGAGAAAAPMNPYAAPGGYTAAPVAPPNTQFTGSQDMMNPAQQASNQANAQQNPPTKGEAVQNFVQDNQTALMVGGAALLGGAGYLAYRSNQNKKEAAAAAQKSKSSGSSSTPSSGKPSPPDADSRRSSSESGRSTTSTTSTKSTTPTSHSGSSKSSFSRMGGKLKGLSLLGSLAPKRKTPPPPVAHGRPDSPKKQTENEQLLNQEYKRLNAQGKQAHFNAGSPTNTTGHKETTRPPQKTPEQQQREADASLAELKAKDGQKTQPAWNKDENMGIDSLYSPPKPSGPKHQMPDGFLPVN